MTKAAASAARVRFTPVLPAATLSTWETAEVPVPAEMDCPLHQQALRIPDQPFLISATETLSFQEADFLCGRYQSWLRREGIPSHQPLAIELPTSPDLVCLLFACLREQIIFSPLNLRLPETKILEILASLGSERRIRELPKLGKHEEEAFRVSEKAVATMLCTSGSSGQPKVVAHTLANHLASAESANIHAPLEPGDRWLCSLPFYHVGGMAVLFRCVLAGAALVFPKAGEGGVESVLRCKPSHVSWVPTQLGRWLESGENHSFRRILLGGAPVPLELLERAKERRLPVAVSYGMTETASQISATPPGETPLGAGRVMSHAEVKLSECGEILVRGSSVSADCTDAEGWLHTRDCGRIEKGILFVEGRIDLQFISGGENIQPEEIEAALIKVPEITQAVVVPVEDEEFGQRPAAWVDVDVSPEKIIRWEHELRKRLPGYMLPVAYRTLPASKTEGLKRNRKELAW